VKIGLIASVWISSPPKNFGFGSQEYLTYYIAEGLVKRGHQVTLFAPGDSKTSARLFSVWPRQIIDLDFPDSHIKDMFELMNLSEVYKLASEFDIIHNHLLPYGLLFANDVNTPTVHTLHHVIYRNHPIYKTKPDVFIYERYKDQNFITISNAQRKIIPELNYIATVYNGVDPQFYTFQPEPTGDYLLYIGRIKRYKGIHIAIELAQSLGLTLKIACNLPQVSQPDYQEVNEYWENEIKPKISGKIEMLGMVEGNEKVKLIQNAKALIFAVTREEPFGMTIIESMSCGTPVIAYSGGAVAELIIDGQTGFIIDQDDKSMKNSWLIKKTGTSGLTEAIQRLYKLDKQAYLKMRQQSHNHVTNNFSIEKMVDGYEAIYKNILNNS
jgi:glycosyltransferase involved in cell wall biosynthesis